jgi:hypothetical protein
MAEHTVVKEQLTAEMIDAGAELTAELDEAGLPLAAAFWLFDSEVNEWRLVFASTEVDTRGPLHVYRMIDEARDRLGAKAEAAPFGLITVRSPHEELVRALASRVPTAPGAKPVRLRKDMAEGRFIDDALIYRAA